MGTYKLDTLNNHDIASCPNMTASCDLGVDKIIGKARGGGGGGGGAR